MGIPSSGEIKMGGAGTNSIAQVKAGTDTGTASAVQNVSLRGLSVDGVNDFQYIGGAATDIAVAGNSPDQVAPHAMSEFHGYIQSQPMSISTIDNLRQSGSGIAGLNDVRGLSTNGAVSVIGHTSFVFQYYQPFFTTIRSGANHNVTGTDGSIYQNVAYLNFGSTTTMATGSSITSASSDQSGVLSSGFTAPDYFKVKWTRTTNTSSSYVTASEFDATTSPYAGAYNYGYAAGLTNDTWTAFPSSTSNTPQYGITFQANLYRQNPTSTMVTSIAEFDWNVEVWYRKSGYDDTKVSEHEFRIYVLGSVNFQLGGR